MSYDSQAQDQSLPLEYNCDLRAQDIITSFLERENAAKDSMLNTATEALNQDSDIVFDANQAIHTQLDFVEHNQTSSELCTTNETEQKKGSPIFRHLKYNETQRAFYTMQQKFKNSMTQLKTPDIALRALIVTLFVRVPQITILAMTLARVYAKPTILLAFLNQQLQLALLKIHNIIDLTVFKMN
ncbi:MAG: hypothetical protein EZS28_024969 [Streblomastix strix]|uniref:Uncharacterized protein n=1 Tax=Streblomastix strix TaxID=222440 RepID=A0A5J4VAN2_9EUKA|nr:MAG: hypothetical protein EZS28_024969 [Streblomastix strix]